jgi:hypothetical protein
MAVRAVPFRGGMDSDPWVRCASMLVLGKLGVAAYEDLVRALETERDPMTLAGSAYALALGAVGVARERLRDVYTGILGQTFEGDIHFIELSAASRVAAARRAAAVLRASASLWKVA